MGHRKTVILVWLTVATALAACGGASESERIMIKPSGSLQCQPSVTTQDRLDAELVALAAAGARTNGGRCVLDGLAYVALCGASAGEAFEVAVAVDSVPVAVQLGFAFADDYPDRKPLPCK